MKPRTNENEQWEAHGGHCAQPQAHKGNQARSTGWSGLPQKTPDATGQSLKGFCRHSVLLIETMRKEMQIQMQSIRDLWVMRDTTVTKRKPHSVCRNQPAGIRACTTQDYRRRADPQWGRCAQHLYSVHQEICEWITQFPNIPCPQWHHHKLFDPGTVFKKKW